MAPKFTLPSQLGEEASLGDSVKIHTWTRHSGLCMIHNN
jgi:hypothetical protein